MGRLVITHSTYLEGLIPLLKALAREGGINTVTPPVIGVDTLSRKLSLRPRTRLITAGVTVLIPTSRASTVRSGIKPSR